MFRPPPLSTLFPYTTLFRPLSARAGLTRRKLGRWPGRECVTLSTSGPVAGSIVDPLLTRPRLWRPLPRSRECHQLRKICSEVRDGTEALHRRPVFLDVQRRSEEHTSELQSHSDLVCRLLLEKKKKKYIKRTHHLY